MSETSHGENVSDSKALTRHGQKPVRKRQSANAAAIERTAVCEDAHFDTDVLQRMLQMADRYAREGHRRQALDLLWRILRHPSCGPHSSAARRAVMAIARTYESEGARHMALELLERLLDV